MRIHDVLRNKGQDVATAAPDDTVRVLVARLTELRIGALVVSSNGQGCDGIVSERDVVRRIDRDGPAALDLPISAIMTRDVHSCGPDASVDDLMRLMTEHRVRHVPVLENDRLVGIVSIGDVVKHRMDELQAERDQLVGYLHS